jgi:cytidylate kinase
MQTPKHRSLEQLTEEQLVKWQRQRVEQEKGTVRPQPKPCVSVSREPGSGGTEVARRLANDLGMDLIGSKIIQQVAERADISEKVIASLDEKQVRLRDIWLESLFQSRSIFPNDYLRYLAKVIGTIGKQGNTIIIGRGGQFLLPPEETFRVRLVAPREVRIRNVMRYTNADYATAERYVSKTDTDRSAFHRRYFGADWTNPIYYDLTLNTGTLGTDGAVASVEAAFVRWKDIPRAQPSVREK